MAAVSNHRCRPKKSPASIVPKNLFPLKEQARRAGERAKRHEETLKKLARKIIVATPRTTTESIIEAGHQNRSCPFPIAKQLPLHKPPLNPPSVTILQNIVILSSPLPIDLPLDIHQILSTLPHSPPSSPLKPTLPPSLPSGCWTKAELAQLALDRADIKSSPEEA